MIKIVYLLILLNVALFAADQSKNNRGKLPSKEQIHKEIIGSDLIKRRYLIPEIVPLIAEYAATDNRKICIRILYHFVSSIGEAKMCELEGYIYLPKNEEITIADSKKLACTVALSHLGGYHSKECLNRVRLALQKNGASFKSFVGLHQDEKAQDTDKLSSFQDTNQDTICFCNC